MLETGAAYGVSGPARGVVVQGSFLVRAACRVTSSGVLSRRALAEICDVPAGRWDRERLNRRPGRRALLLGRRTRPTGRRTLIASNSEGEQVAAYCGIDWAEGHHDIAVVDDQGTLLAKRRVDESPAGLAELIALLVGIGDDAASPVPVAIETPRGLLVAALRATGRPIYPINPMVVARYRERTSLSGKKSNHVDAMALANILRTDRHLHRLLPDDSPEVRAISVLARGYQDAVWPRTKVLQELRARLVEFYPGFLAAFGAGSGAGSGMSTTQLATGDARAVLAIAPSPADGRRVSVSRVEAALRRGGRQRRITARAAQVAAALRLPQLRQDLIVEAAMRAEALDLLGVLDAACGAADALAVLLAEVSFQSRPPVMSAARQPWRRTGAGPGRCGQPG